jgi:hypothetical protein
MDVNVNNTDQTKVWLYGKIDKGWYVAKWLWDANYAKDMEVLGYQVKRSKEKPTEIPVGA